MKLFVEAQIIRNNRRWQISGNSEASETNSHKSETAHHGREAN
jgi:hypothetical protein